MADGVADNRIHRIVGDSRGFLWFCTSDGLSRFDGHSFITFNVDNGLPFPSINDLLETRNHEYWVATNRGGVREVGKSNTRGARPVNPDSGRDVQRLILWTKRYRSVSQC